MTRGQDLAVLTATGCLLLSLCLHPSSSHPLARLLHVQATPETAVSVPASKTALKNIAWFQELENPSSKGDAFASTQRTRTVQATLPRQSLLTREIADDASMKSISRMGVVPKIVPWIYVLALMADGHRGETRESTGQKYATESAFRLYRPVITITRDTSLSHSQIKETPSWTPALALGDRNIPGALRTLSKTIRKEHHLNKVMRFRDENSASNLVSQSENPKANSIVAEAAATEQGQTLSMESRAAGRVERRFDLKYHIPQVSVSVSHTRIPDSSHLPFISRSRFSGSPLLSRLLLRASHHQYRPKPDMPLSLRSVLSPDNRPPFSSSLSHSSSTSARSIDLQSPLTPDNLDAGPTPGGGLAALEEPVNKTNTASAKPVNSGIPPPLPDVTDPGHVMPERPLMVEESRGANEVRGTGTDEARADSGKHLALYRTTTTTTLLEDDRTDKAYATTSSTVKWWRGGHHQAEHFSRIRKTREASVGVDESTDEPAPFLPTPLTDLPAGELGASAVTLSASWRRQILHNLDSLGTIGQPATDSDGVATDATAGADNSDRRLLGVFGSLLNRMYPNVTTSSAPPLLSSGAANIEVPCGDKCEELGGICIMGSQFQPRCQVSREIEETGCLNGFRCDHGTCRNGSARCECDPGWTGPFCADRCELECDHGYCFRLENDSSVCVCHVNYTGPLCTEFNPPDVTKKDGVPVEVVPDSWPMVLAGVGMGLLLLLLLLLFLPYLTWRRRWLPMRRLVRYFQHYEDDDGKPYDAFVSYKSCMVDEAWVVHKLYPKLEKELDFKLCLHFRDFPPGETIANNIIHAIENSRRTIMVLSPSYVESEWCRLEYQKAQHEMLKLKHKIIPVVLEDISSIKDMDRNLKTLLDTVTYIQWPRDQESDDKRLEKFWKHMELAMPKKRSESSSSVSSGGSHSTDIAMTSVSSSSESEIPEEVFEERATPSSDSPVFVDIRDAEGVELDEDVSDAIQESVEKNSTGGSLGRHKQRVAKYARSESTEVMLDATGDCDDPDYARGSDKYVVKMKRLPGNRLKIFRSKIMGPRPEP